MTITGLLNGLHNILVNAEGKSAKEGKEKRVRNDGNDRKDGKGEKDHQTDAKDDARVLWVAPVDELSNCKEGNSKFN